MAVQLRFRSKSVSCSRRRTEASSLAVGGRPTLTVSFVPAPALIGQAMKVDASFEPVDVDVKRDLGLSVTFVDGYVARFEVAELRLNCPGATCRNLRDRDEDVWPRPGSPTPLRIADAELHGAWGIRITWNDTHATGIYPFEELRRWSESRSPGPGPTRSRYGRRDTLR